MKNFKKLILAALLLTAGCGEKTATAETGMPDTKWYSNNPTATDFTISNADQLAGLAAVVNGTWGGVPERDNFNGKTVTLTKDIDLAAYGNWIPIGRTSTSPGANDRAPFSGTFDGGGRVISNLTINSPDKRNQGLFGNVVNGRIKNIGLERVNIVGDVKVGAVVGLMIGSSVANCYSTGTVTARDHVGGVVGSASGNCFVTNCYSTAGVSGTGYAIEAIHSAVGGVAGLLNNYSMATNCYSTGAVDGAGNAGGVVGAAREYSRVKGSVALNPQLTGKGNVNRVVAFATPHDIFHTHNVSLTSNNAGYTEMRKSGRQNTVWDFKGANKYSGADIFASEINVDGTLGGRFTNMGVWTTEPGKLPGLFGRVVEMPPHLAAGDRYARRGNSTADTTAPNATVSRQPQEHSRMRDRMLNLPEGGTLTGNRSIESVQRVIMTEHRAAFRQIHHWRRSDKPELSGTVVVRFTIDEFGRVTSAELAESTVGDPELENSVILRVEHMDFERIDKPGDVAVVVYPFTFAPPQARAESASSARRVPTTLKECYIALDNQLSEEVKDDIALSSLMEFVSNAHFGLGMWIRNNWIHHPKDSELAKLLRAKGVTNPDGMSSLILRGYYYHLDGVEKTIEDLVPRRK